MARPRKLNVIREKNGREQRNVVSAEVLFYRMRDLNRDGISTDHAKDALAGFTLGRLLLRWRADKSDPGGISQQQYDAGEQWSSIVRKHAAIMGYKLHIHSPSFVMVGGGRDSNPDPDESYITALRRQWSDSYSALMQSCVDHGMRVRDVTYGVCIENWPAATLTLADYGGLRIGLNTLARVLR